MKEFQIKPTLYMVNCAKIWISLLWKNQSERGGRSWRGSGWTHQSHPWRGNDLLLAHTAIRIKQGWMQHLVEVEGAGNIEWRTF